jgi:hypothetical protein
MQEELDELAAIVKRQSLLAEQHEAEHDELLELRGDVRYISRSLSAGHRGLPQETLVRMYQADDELKRMRVVLADAIFDSRNAEVRAFAQGVLDGHLRTPAMRVTDPNNPL